MEEKPNVPPEVLERLRQAAERGLEKDRDPPRPADRKARPCSLLRRWDRPACAPEPRRLYTTTLGDVMARNGRKFPTIPDLTLADLEGCRRDGIAVNWVAAMRLHHEYLRVTGEHTSETAAALANLWQKDQQHSEADWAAIYKGFFRVEQARRADAGQAGRRKG